MIFITTCYITSDRILQSNYASIFSNIVCKRRLIQRFTTPRWVKPLIKKFKSYASIQHWNRGNRCLSSEDIRWHVFCLGHYTSWLMRGRRWNLQTSFCAYMSETLLAYAALIIYDIQTYIFYVRFQPILTCPLISSIESSIISTLEAVRT